MPSGSEDVADTTDERDDEIELEERHVDRPKDPLLFLVGTFDRALRNVDGLHARFEELPGRVRSGVGVLTFVSSAYLGPAIKRALDSLVGTTLGPLVNDFMAFSLGTQVTLAILALLVVQVTVASEKLTIVVELVESVTGDNELFPDGGVRTRRVDTSEAGAIGGAAFGAIFGGLFGYTSTIFGGMVLGAIVGDLVEERSVRNRKRRRLKARIVAYLLRERVFRPETVEAGTVPDWFPSDDEGFVVEALEELVRKDDSPVVRKSDGICLVGASEAVAYLDRNGGRVPSAFAGPNRPPRPTEEGT